MLDIQLNIKPPIRESEVELILKNIKKYQLDIKISIILAFYCGLKIEEIIKLTKDNFKDNTIIIDKRIITLPLCWKDEYIQNIPLKKKKRAIQACLTNNIIKLGLNKKYCFMSLRYGFLYYCYFIKGYDLNYILNLMNYSKRKFETKQIRQINFNINQKIRLEVLKRDNFKCVYCGKSAFETKLHIDHIIPISKNGNNKIENLQTLCEVCNLSKSNKII